jgi:hypothetical protein
VKKDAFRIVCNNLQNKLHWIQVRIDPPHPLMCRKRRLNGAVLRMKPEKSRSCVTVGDHSLLNGHERRA